MTITVKIAERSYPIAGVNSPRDEEQARKAAQSINDRLLKYKGKFSERDIQDLLAVTALEFAVRLKRLENTEMVELEQRLNLLNEKLDTILCQDIDNDVLLN